MKTTIDCPACAGTGRTPLPEALQETLDALPKRSKSGVLDIFLKLKHRCISTNAVNNRLEALRELGFVTRERQGRFWFYSRA